MCVHAAAVACPPGVCCSAAIWSSWLTPQHLLHSFTSVSARQFYAWFLKVVWSILSQQLLTDVDFWRIWKILRNQACKWCFVYAAPKWPIWVITFRDSSGPNSRVGLSEGLICAATRLRFSKRLPTPEVPMVSLRRTWCDGVKWKTRSIPKILFLSVHFFLPHLSDLMRVCHKLTWFALKYLVFKILKCA